MKKSFTLLVLFLCLLPLGADSFYAGGASALYGTSRGEHTFAGGLYFDTYYSYPINNTPLRQGFGTRIEAATPHLEKQTMIGITVGYALEWNVTDSFDMYFLLGPTLSCNMDAKREDPATISIGGGLGANMNFYLNEKRTIGIMTGVRCALEATTVDSDTRPVFYTTATLGMAMKFGRIDNALPSHSYKAENGLEEE